MRQPQETNSINELDTVIKKFFSFYDDGCAPPEWILINDIWKKYMNQTIIYFDSSDNSSTTLENVKALSKKREPVNIEMQRCYDHRNLGALWGYQVGNYGSFDHSINISIFTQTPFKYYAHDRYSLVNLLNVVAPAFDSPQQPDQKYFDEGNNSNALIQRFTLIFKMIINCAKSKNLPVVCLTGFGLGAFNNKSEHYIQGFLNAISENNITGIEFLMMDYTENLTKEINDLFGYEFITWHFTNYDELGRAVGGVLKKFGSNNVLFTNPWDPWSVLGNGNSNDNSWDGNWGRRTAISVLGLPQLNHEISYVDLAC